MSRIVGRKYALEDLLGRGSMGSVYRARHILTNQTVALKLIAPEIANTPNGQHRFGREVRVAATVGHSGLVQVFDAGTEQETNTMYLAMELLHGENLKDRSRQLDFSLRMGLQFVRATLDALAAAHAHGFVHRDIKPENIFIHRPAPNVEQVKLLDFGIARDLAEDAQSSTAAHIALGTPHYMSPEQATNAREVSPATDVWSVGVMMYWLLAGKLPFNEDTAFNTLAKVCGSDPDPIDIQNSELRHQLSQLTYLCLAKDPDHRPKNAGDLAALLDRILGPFSLASSQESAAYTNPASSTFEQVAPAFGPYSTPPPEGLPPSVVQRPQATTQPLPFVGGSSDVSAQPAFHWKRAALGALFFLFGGIALAVWYMQGGLQSLTSGESATPAGRPAIAAPVDKLKPELPSPSEVPSESALDASVKTEVKTADRKSARTGRPAAGPRRRSNAKRRRAPPPAVPKKSVVATSEVKADAPTEESKDAGLSVRPTEAAVSATEPAKPGKPAKPEEIMEEPTAPSLPAAPKEERAEIEPPTTKSTEVRRSDPRQPDRPDRPAAAPPPAEPKKKTKSNKKKTEDFLTF